MKYIKKNKKISSGMTIIEMMVAISIFTIGIAGFSLLFTRIWRGNSYTLEMGQSTMVVSQATNKMMKYIRETTQADNGSYPIVSANDNDLVLYSDYNKDSIVERLHFYKSGKNILMGVRNPTNTMPKTYASGDQQTTTIANNIVNDSSTPIFYYYNKNYPGDAANNPLKMPVNVANIRLMKIYLQININPNRAPDNVQMQSFIELRNLNDYDHLK